MEEQKGAEKHSKERTKSAKNVTYIRHKRPPIKRLSRRPNDVYINRTTQFGHQLSRCHRLLEQSFDDITVHGLGSAIHQAINLALQLQETSTYPIKLTATTSTVQLTDDLEPVDDVRLIASPGHYNLKGVWLPWMGLYIQTIVLWRNNKSLYILLFQDVEYRVQTRPNSAIHIKIAKSPSPSSASSVKSSETKD